MTQYYLKFTCVTLSRYVPVQKFLGSKWPEPLGDEWRNLNLEFQAATHGVALKVLQALAIALGRGEHFFDEVILIHAPQRQQPSMTAWHSNCIFGGTP